MILLSAPISKAKTILAYNSGDIDLMSFRGNAEAIVYMKSAGSNPDLWYVNIDGKSGFASSQFLREQKIYVKNPEFVIPTVIKRKESDVQPNKVQHAHEVIEGTTIYATEPTVGATQETPTTEATYESTPSYPYQETTSDNNVQEVTDNIWNNNHNSQPLAESSEPPVDVGIQETTPSVPTESPLQATDTTSVPITTTEAVLTDNFAPTANTYLSEQPMQQEPIIASNLPEQMLQPETPLNQNFEAPAETTPSPIEYITPEYPEIREEVSNNVQVNQIPPESFPSSPLTTISGDINTQTIEVPEKVDLLQEKLNPPEFQDYPENTSNSASNIESQLPQITENVPDKSPEVATEVPTVQEYDNSNIYNHENTLDNINGAREESSSEGIEEDSNVLSETISALIPEVVEKASKEKENTGDILASFNLDDTMTVPQQSQKPMTEYSSTPESIVEEYTTTPAPIPDVEGYYRTTEVRQPSYDTYTTESSQPSYDTDTTEASQQSYDRDTTEASQPSYDTYTTENPATQEEPSEGLVSSMFSTVANMWASTESPPTESLNADSNEQPMQTDSNEQPERTDFNEQPVSAESNEGFSFLNYFWTTYNSVMGAREQSQALFPSAGKF